MLTPMFTHSVQTHSGDDDRKGILDFQAVTKEWVPVGDIIEARSFHAVSTINFEAAKEFCIM